MCLEFRDGEVGCWQRTSSRQDVLGGSRRGSNKGTEDGKRLQKEMQVKKWRGDGVGVRLWGKGTLEVASLPCSLTCLLTSSRLSATPLSALLLLASFWHFPRLHSRCLMTWERFGAGWVEQSSQSGVAPSSPDPSPPYLIGIVKEFQHCEDAGPDEQSHLAPDVTCGVRSERLVGSGPRGLWGSIGLGQASHVC